MFVFLLNGRLKHHADAPLRLAAARPWLDDTDGCAPRGSSATLCCTPVCSPHHVMGSTSMCFLYGKRHSDWGGVSQTQLEVPRRRVACCARRARRSAATAHARSHARHRGHAPATRTIGLAQRLTSPAVTPFAPGHSMVTPRRLQTPPPPPPPLRSRPSTAGGMSLPEAAVVVAALPSRHLSSGLRGPTTLRVAVLPAPPCSLGTPRSGRLH